MSYGETPNPYASPGASAYGPPGAVIPRFTQLQYMQAFKYVMESPNWMMNLVWGALAFLSSACIPIVGPLIFMGYMYEIINHLHTRRTMPYPDFDTGKFGEYLSRGVPPFVANLIFGLVFGMVAGVLYAFTSIVVMVVASGDSGVATAIAFLVGTFAFILFFVLLIAMMAITTPMTLRAGLSGSIAEGFKFDFIKDFIARMWKDMLLAYLFLMIAGQILGLIGMLACFIGIYPAGAWNMLASGHLQWQLYELYLERGGMKIPLRDEVKV